jgi:RNA polymerase sigma factor (sigma-70 family)
MDAEPSVDQDQAASMPAVSVLRPTQKLPEAARAAPDKISDERLISGILEGDRNLAGALYDQLRAPIDSALRRILHQPGPDFEDHVQITFERLLRSLAEGRFEGRSSLTTWACAIASHVALDALRLRQRERERTGVLPDQDELACATRTDKRLESLRELRRIQGILLQMKPDRAETLLLHDVLGHTLTEIAELHQATESATQSRLHRARLELKRRAAQPISGRTV